MSAFKQASPCHNGVWQWQRALFSEHLKIGSFSAPCTPKTVRRPWWVKAGHLVCKNNIENTSNSLKITRRKVPQAVKARLVRTQLYCNSTANILCSARLSWRVPAFNCEWMHTGLDHVNHFPCIISLSELRHDRDRGLPLLHIPQ